MNNRKKGEDSLHRPCSAQREKKSVVQWMTQGGSIPGGGKVSSVLSGSTENEEQEEKGK